MTTRILPAADINVTPLIDVMLVLLIIFMVVTPLAHQRASRSVSYGQVVAGLDAVRGAGAERIGLIPREPADR
jgi:biopolymer transport protein ExbD